MTDVEIRPLGPDDDLEAQADLGEQAFGGKSAAERERWMRAAAAQVSRGAFLGAFADGRPVGAAKYHDMRQWWHGRAVPLAGVADVKVAPEYGGRGIGTRLMTRLLDRIADRGYPVAALYPATMPIYRSLGWELAGACYQATVPSRELRSLLAPDPALAGASGDPRAAPAPPPDAAGLRRATPDDAAEVAAVLDRVHQAGRHNGPLTRDDLTIRDWLSRDGQYVYLAADGILGYQWDGDHELFVERVAAASPAAGRALWALLASQSSMVRTVRARLAPDDPLWWLTRERDVRAVSRSMWMLRIVDAPAAIAARGFPPSVSLSVRLNITDPARPSNDGRWQLEVDGGKGSLTPAAPGPRAVADDPPLTPGASGPRAAGGGLSSTLAAPGRNAAGDGPPLASGASGARAAGGGPSSALAAPGPPAVAESRPGTPGACGASAAGGGSSALLGRSGPRAAGDDADPPLALGARGLAALYGGTPLATLRHAGLASGGSPDADAALDAAFPGPSFMLDAF